MTPSTTTVIDIVPINVRQLQRINENFVFSVSMALNALLIAVLCTEKNRALIVYNNVLLLNCACDILYTTTCFFVNMQFELNGGQLVMVLADWLDNFPLGVHRIALAIYSLSTYLCLFVIPIVFYFRYCIVVKSRQLSKMQILCLFSILSLVSAVLAVELVGSTVFGSRPKSCAYLLHHPMWTYGGRNVDKCLQASSMNPLLISYLLTASLVNAFSYSAMLYFTVQVFSTLKRSRSKYSAKTIELQRQMNVLLMIQLSLPLIFACVPVTFFVTVGILQLKVAGSGFIVLGMLSWLPVVNPIIIICFITSYRRRAMHILAVPTRLINEKRATSVHTITQNSSIQIV